MALLSSTFRRLAALSFLMPCVAITPAFAAPALPALGATIQDLTVSGVSSGAYMAVQFHVAHSKLVRGAGVLAGGPYDCADASIWRALTSCMSPSSWAPLPSVAELRARTETLSASGRIDPVDNLRHERVWLLSGGRDTTVRTAVMDRLAAFYAEWLDPAAIRFVKIPDAAHAMISTADPQAKPCASEESPFINRCGDLDAAGELLSHLLGPLQPPTGAARGEMLSFDQTPFIDGKPTDSGLADEAYVYVPLACRNMPCRLHVAFHGCRQSAAQIGRRFVDGTGYNAWADHNRIIVLYPQTVPRVGFAMDSRKWLSNPFACWDWWGYTGTEYATRDGKQIKAVRAMLERLATPAQP